MNESAASSDTVAPAPSAPSALRQALAKRAPALSVLAWGGLVGPLLARRWWLAELASHFAVQWWLLATFALSIALLARRWRWGMVAAIPWVVLTALVAPELVPLGAPLGATPAAANSSANEQERGPLVVMLANVLLDNPRHELLFEQVERERPDLLIVCEFTPEWQAAIRDKLGGAFPYAIEQPQSGAFGIALYSRRPLEGRVLGRDSHQPMIRAEVARGAAAPWVVWGVHPLPPISTGRARLRDQQLAWVAERTREDGELVVVVGDFNATPWCPAFRDLVRDSGLHDTRRGWGLQATFPARTPAPLRIPIDHVLCGAGVAVRRREVLPSIGSDHRPVVVELLPTGRME